MFHANCQKDLKTEKYIMGKRDFAKFEFKLC